MYFKCMCFILKVCILYKMSETIAFLKKNAIPMIATGTVFGDLSLAFG